MSLARYAWKRFRRLSYRNPPILIIAPGFMIIKGLRPFDKLRVAGRTQVIGNFADARIIFADARMISAYARMIFAYARMISADAIMISVYAIMIFACARMIFVYVIMISAYGIMISAYAILMVKQRHAVSGIKINLTRRLD